MLLIVAQPSAEWNERYARLFDAGILFYKATEENACFLADQKEIGGVLIDAKISPVSAEKTANAIKRKYPEMPIALWTVPDFIPSAEVDRVLRDSDGNETEAFLDFFSVNCRRSPAPLSTSRLTVSPNPGGDVFYCGSELKLTPRLHRLLYCLFYLYPRVAPVDDLLSLCDPVGLTAANLTVLVHELNRRAKKIDQTKLVESVRGKGYCLRKGLLEP